MSAQECSVEVCVHNPAPLVVGELQKVTRGVASPGIVDQDVEAAEGVGEIVYDARCFGQVGLCEVEVAYLTSAARGLYRLQRLLSPASSSW